MSNEIAAKFLADPEGEFKRLVRDLSALSGSAGGKVRACLFTLARERFSPVEPVDDLELEIAFARVPSDAFAGLPNESSPDRPRPPPDEPVYPADPGWTGTVVRVYHEFPGVLGVAGNANLRLRLEWIVSHLIGASRAASDERTPWRAEAAEELARIAGRRALEKIVGAWDPVPQVDRATGPALTAVQVDVTLNGLASSTAGPPPPQELVAW